MESLLVSRKAGDTNERQNAAMHAQYAGPGLIVRWCIWLTCKHFFAEALHILLDISEHIGGKNALQ